MFVSCSIVVSPRPKHLQGKLRCRVNYREFKILVLDAHTILSSSSAYSHPFNIWTGNTRDASASTMIGVKFWVPAWTAIYLFLIPSGLGTEAHPANRPADVGAGVSSGWGVQKCSSSCQSGDDGLTTCCPKFTGVKAARLRSCQDEVCVESHLPHNQVKVPGP